MAITVGGGVNKVILELDQVDNTSDLNKPISTATQAALDAKPDSVDVDKAKVFAYAGIVM